MTDKNQPLTDIRHVLRTDDDGTIRVSGTRVTLDTVIAGYHQGDTPEDLHEAFDVLPVDDIYTVLSYYMNNRAEIDLYLAQREKEAEQIREKIESTYTAKQWERHQKLLQRIEEKRKQLGN